MNTRKYPRTLAEAFGPYEGTGLVTDEPMHKHDRIVMWACAVGVVSIVFSLFVWA
jgi:hypothetical protein